MKKWELRSSDIHGVGVFNTNWLHPKELIDVGITFFIGFIPNVTFFGSKINHSYSPNAILRYDSKSNTYNVYSDTYMPPNTEITINYQDTPFFIMGPESHYK